MMELLIAAVILFYLSISAAIGAAAFQRGREASSYFVWSLLSPVITMLVLLIRGTNREVVELRSGRRIRCGACLELAYARALKCPHCGSPLAPSRGLEPVRNMYWRTSLAMLLLSVLAFGGALAGAFEESKPKQVAAAPPTAPLKVQSKPGSRKTNAAVSSKVEVELSSFGTVDATLWADDQQVWQGSLKPGERRSIIGQGKVVARFSDASLVYAKVNGVDRDALGRGERTVTFTAAQR